jgi:hypothetical protein
MYSFTIKLEFQVKEFMFYFTVVNCMLRILRFCTCQTEQSSGSNEHSFDTGHPKNLGSVGGFGVNMFNKRHFFPAIFFFLLSTLLSVCMSLSIL